MPAWANENPIDFWRQADKHERANAAVYRELEASLPNELSISEHEAMIATFIDRHVGSKAYQYAIHEPTSALEGIDQPHVHIMVCDRAPDGIERPPELFFKRFNRANPESGGRLKVNGATSRSALQESTKALRKEWADINNAFLEKAGLEVRVDHRSYKDRGMERQPERHLGRLGVQRMTEESKEQLRRSRQEARNQI